jgi:Transglycosylase SLT domain
MIALLPGLFALPVGPAAAGRMSAAAPVTILRGWSHAAGEPGTVETVAFADPRVAPVTVLRGEVLVAPPELVSAAPRDPLERVAFAVDGAESSHGTDPAMWHPELDGPQGPMQVSAAAAFDVGGGDRFDLDENRSLGRAYLAHLYRRYGNWPDAIAAYNWGPGNLDAWIAGGRPADGLPLAVANYRNRVLRDVGLPPPTARAK